MYFQNHNNRFQKNSFKKENNNFTQNTYTEQIPFNNETILQDIKKMDDNYLLSISNTKWDGVSNFTFNYYAIDELCNRYSEFKKQVENKRNNNNFIFTHPIKSNCKPDWKPNINVSTFVPTFKPPPPSNPYPRLSSTSYKPPHIRKNVMYQLEKQMNNCFLKN